MDKYVARFVKALIVLTVLGAVVIALLTAGANALVSQGSYPTQGFVGGIAKAIYHVLPTSQHAFAFGVFIGDVVIVGVVLAVLWCFVNAVRGPRPPCPRS